MAEALIGGLIAKGVFVKDEIVACAPSESTRQRVSGNHGIRMYGTAKEVCRESEIVVLAVKPKQVPEVFEEGLDLDGKMLVSIVAGLTLGKMAGYAPNAKNVRVMPNHCCMVLEGAMGYCCGPSVTDDDRERVASILGAVGLAAEVGEEYMDAITGIAGSSPAFLYIVIDAMADAGVLNGLSRADSIRLAAQSRSEPPKIAQKPPQPRAAASSCIQAGVAGMDLISSRRLRACSNGRCSDEMSLESWFTATTLSSLAPLIGMNSALSSPP